MKLPLAALCASTAFSSVASSASAGAYPPSSSLTPSVSQDPMRLDWYRQGIGAVSTAVFSTTGNSVYVGTDAGVIASVSQSDGSLNWRRVLPAVAGNAAAPVDDVEVRLGMLISLSDGGRHLNFWKAKDGTLRQSKTLFSNLGGDDADAAITDGRRVAEAASAGVASNTFVDLQLFSLAGSSKSSEQRVAAFAGNAVNVFSLDGKEKWSWDGATANAETPCAIESGTVTDDAVIVACSNSDVIYSLDAKLGGWTIVDSEEHDRAAAATAAAVAVQTVDVEAVKTKLTEAAAITSDSVRSRLEESGVNVVHAFAPNDASSDSQTAATAFGASLSDGAFVLVNADGKVAFVREEGLSSIAQVIAVDLNRRAAAQAAGHLEKLSGTSLPERLASQASMAASLIASMPLELATILTGAPGANDGGETFIHSIGKKIVIAVGNAGRVFGLDSITGELRWSRMLAPEPTADVHVLSASVEGGVQVLVVNGGSASTVLLDVLTGSVRAESAAPAVQDVRTILRVAVAATADSGIGSSSDPHCDSEGDAPTATVVVHTDGSVAVVGDQHTVADVATAVAASGGGQLFFQAVDYDEGIVSGLVLEAGPAHTVQARELWSVPLGDGLPTGERSSVLEACAVVDSHEKIQVLGLPFANDGVLLKYINPNMMACAVSHAETEDAPAVVDVVVLDTVTGRSLYRHAHEDAAGPIQMVFSENSLVYSYLRVDNAARTELSSIALYETSLGTYDLLPWKSLGRKDSFSSYDEQMPVVLQKTFTYPEGIRRLAVSRTAHGVSEKAFLVYTSSGRVAFLRRDLLDPRRPDLAAGAKADPSVPLKPYHGHLVQIPTDVVSYHLVVEDGFSADTQLMSFPTHMESTSEVLLAGGLDMFYARFAPSTPYDMLPEEFQKQIILLAAVGVPVGVFVAHRVAVQKNLKTVWK